MPARSSCQNRIELLQGTLDMLNLRNLKWGPQHGHGIGQAIRAQSEELIDERLEALTARHKAFAVNVQRIGRDLDSLGTKVNKLTNRVDKLVGVVESLAQIVTRHERRRNHLEG